MINIEKMLLNTEVSSFFLIMSTVSTDNGDMFYIIDGVSKMIEVS